MAEEILGKTYRIDDRRYDKQGAKVEVWTKGRHKFVLWYSDASGPTSKEVYIEGDKISASLTDDEVINALLDERKKAYEFNKKNNINNPNAGDWKIIQEPYGPYEKRTYGIDYYYLNDGSYFHIVWTEGVNIRSSDNDDATSFIDKRVDLFPPEAAKVGKYYRMGKDSRFGYASDVGYEWQVYSGLQKNSEIAEQVIFTIKLQLEKAFGISTTDNKLSLCSPDTRSCSLIEFKDFLSVTPPVLVSPTGTTQSSEPTGTQSIIPSKSITLSVEDDFTINALTNFNVKGVIGTPESTVIFESEGEELDEEYQEAAIITEAEQIRLDLEVYAFQGDSEGLEEETSGSDTTTTSTGGGVNTNGQNAGGSGIYRFQQKLIIRGRTVKNGEVPDDLLAKVSSFPGGEGLNVKLEKHAAPKFAAMNKAFKEKFGKNFTISGPYRTFNVSNDIFDWNYFDKTGKGRKKGTNGGTAAAKPGTSKHGWGQAMDIGGFGNGPGNQYFDWMEQNAKKYGWINPAWAKKPGAGYEPWHWEYIGDDLFT